MSAQKYSLEQAIRAHLAPQLRQDGFAGSGRNFWRLSGDLIHALQVQGSRDGGQFAINLGIQPRYIPDVSGNPPDPKKITVILCEFGRRLSVTGADQWWTYQPSEHSMNQAVQDAAQVYMTVGRAILAVHSAADSPLLSVTPDQFAADNYNFLGFGNTQVIMARTLALMRRAEGKVEQSRAFAQIALDNLRGATGLRSELEQLARCH